MLGRDFYCIIFIINLFIAHGAELSVFRQLAGSPCLAIRLQHYHVFWLAKFMVL